MTFTLFPNVFSDHLGLYKNGKIKLHLKVGTIPKFFKPRPVPVMLRPKIEQEITRLVNCNIVIVSPVESSDWSTLIVPVMKPDGSVRLCGDYRVTIPRVEDLFLSLTGGNTFTKLDLSQAFQQVELEDTSKDVVTIATHKGFFRYNRLPYGVASAPGLFQREMEKLIMGIEGVVCFLDDILVTGKTDDEHFNRLKLVLSRLDAAG
jgi:hypothetical protein